MRFFRSLLLLALSAAAVAALPFPRANILWFDATANFSRFSYPDSVTYYLQKAKELGFTDCVVDVKPITGEVLYPSALVPQMHEWQGSARPKDFHFLRFFIAECRRLGMRAHASINVFVAGHNFFDRGLVYSGNEAWQSLNYTDSGMVPITRLKHKYSAMTNPVNPEVQEHELAVMRELVTLYPELDGIILDRVRFDGIEADFSPVSRQAFEQYSGAAVERYPADIYSWDTSGGKPERREGPRFKQWLEWRASVIYRFMQKARAAVKAANPNISFGIYTGAWYPVYYDVGVNWASNTYDPSADYPWATPDYKKYGYIELLDFYTTGCYFFEVTKDEVAKLNEEGMRRGEAGMGKGKDPWYSVEGSAEIAMQVTKGAVPVYGGLYVEQYKGSPEQFKRAVKMCMQKTDGLMVFDIVHLINNNWWEVLREAMQ